jgi:hypothetical protein
LDRREAQLRWNWPGNRPHTADYVPETATYVAASTLSTCWPAQQAGGGVCMTVISSVTFSIKLIVAEALVVIIATAIPAAWVLVIWYRGPRDYVPVPHVSVFQPLIQVLVYWLIMGYFVLVACVSWRISIELGNARSSRGLLWRSIAASMLVTAATLYSTMFILLNTLGS